MPITKAQQTKLDELYGEMTEGENRDNWKAIAESDPQQFLDPYLRQQEFGSLMRKAGEKEGEAARLLKTNEDWFADNSGRYKELQQREADLTSQLEEAGRKEPPDDEPVIDGNGDLGQVQKDIAALTQNLAQIVETNKSVLTFEQAQDAERNIIHNLTADLDARERIQARHRQDFGGEEVFTADIAKYGAEHELQTLEQAYDAMTADRRVEKRTAEAVAVEKEKWEDKAKADLSAQSLPTAGSGGGVGHFQMKVSPPAGKQAGEGPPEGLSAEERVGWGGEKSGAELVDEGKTTFAPRS